MFGRSDHSVEYTSKTTFPRVLPRPQLRQVYISEVNSRSKHDPLTFESVLAFRRVAHLIPEPFRVIVESRAGQNGVEDEIQSVQKALSFQLAIAGD